MQFYLHPSDDSLCPPCEAQGTTPGFLSYGGATAGGNLLGGGPDFFASAATTSAQAAADATSLRFDDLTFNVPGGGSASVDVHLSGSRTRIGFGSVAWTLNLQNSVFFDLVPDVTSGPWAFSTQWQVDHGVPYHIYLSLSATAYGAGSSSYIDDPMYFVLPGNVTFTSASGNSYAPTGTTSPVPDPGSLLLLGTGLVAVARRRMKQRG